MSQKRRYGQGGLYRTAKGKNWVLRYRGPRTPEHPTGEYRQSSRTTNRGKAAKMLAEKNRQWANLKQGVEGFITPSATKATVADLLDALEKYYVTAKKKSLRETRGKIKRLKSALGPLPAVALKSSSVIDDFVAARRAAKKADATIDRELELLRRAYTLAAERGTLPAMFRPHIPRLVEQGSNARQGFYSLAEFLARVEELPTQLLKDIAWWAFVTGMRRGSVLALTWDGYDKETGTLRLHQRNSKSNEPVVVKLDAWPVLAEIVERRLAARAFGCPLVFHNGKGKKVGDFWCTWERAGARAKVPERSYHDLRRTAARNLRSAGVPESLIMTIGGWKTASVFRRYAVVDEADVASAFAKGAAYIATLPTKLEKKEPVVTELRRPSRGR